MVMEDTVETRYLEKKQQTDLFPILSEEVFIHELCSESLLILSTPVSGQLTETDVALESVTSQTTLNQVCIVPHFCVLQDVTV